MATIASITIAATPTPTPAFAPVLSPPEGVSIAWEDATADVFAEVEGTTLDVGDADVPDGIDDAGPIVAASWNLLPTVPQQDSSPQHQEFPPQFLTGALSTAY
jgi:hypothetical protein